MNKAFRTYEEAYAYALSLANQCQRDAGIAKQREFGNALWFVVRLLPNPENRYADDLTCEVVTPGQPA